MLNEAKKSLEFLSKAAEIFESNLGESHPQTAMTNKNLGDLYLNSSKKDLAKEKYEKCINVFLEVYGEDSDLYITTMNKLQKLKVFSLKIDLN
jgi:tetratricopeptide (TPR) repeat protein